MALLILAATSARAGIIPINVRKSPFQKRHHLLRFTASPDQASHEFHWEIDVMKEQLEAGAQIVQAWFAIGCFNKPIFGAFTVARKAHITLATVTGQRVTLVLAEFYLLR